MAVHSMWKSNKQGRNIHTSYPILEQSISNLPYLFDHKWKLLAWCLCLIQLHEQMFVKFVSNVLVLYMRRNLHSIRFYTFTAVSADCNPGRYFDGPACVTCGKGSFKSATGIPEAGLVLNLIKMYKMIVMSVP